MRRLLTLVSVLLGSLGMLPAGAAEPRPGQMVGERARPATDPAGVRLGPFLGYASVGLRETYDDNLFAEADGGEADLVTTIQPRLRLDGQWSRHDLDLTAEATQRLHADNGGEDSLDYGVRADGRLDLGRETKLTGELHARRLREPRTSPDDPGGKEPTPIDRLGGSLRAEQQLGRLGLAFAASYESLDFGDVDARNGGEINNDDRDREVARVAGRLSYGLSPALEPFVEAGFDLQRYDEARDDNGFDRDSTALEAAIGTRYRMSAAGVLEARLGLRRQRFDDPLFDDVTGVVAEMTAVQRLSPLTSVRGTLIRELQQSTLRGASTFFATRGSLRGEHELRRDILLGVDLAFARNTFAGIAREDTTFAGGFDAAYRANRYLHLTFDYGFTKRVSTADADFTRNRVTLGAAVQY